MSTPQQQQSLRAQNWGDDLRLPCFVNAADTADLLTTLDALRKPVTPVQSKHLPALKRDTWFVLRRPADRSRSGFLCVWPERRCCVYVSGDPLTPRKPTPRVALLRLRVDPQFLAPTAGLTVFAATLSPSARRLSVEDTLIWKGRPVCEEETFPQRHRRAAQWLEHYALLDPRFLSGLTIDLAPWSPLDTVEPEGVWEFCAASDVGRRRLLWIANHAPAVYVSPALSAVAESVASVPHLDIGEIGGSSSSSGPLVAIATRETGPDQWGLTSADGVALGRLLMRKLEISTDLRAFRGNVVRVEVEWVPQFSKWEARCLSSEPASHSTAFAAGRAQA